MPACSRLDAPPGREPRRLPARVRGVRGRPRGTRTHPRSRGRRHHPGGRRGELERTLAELLARAAADGAIRSDVTSGTVLMLLHGIGAGIDRPGWAMEARAAADLVSRGLRAR
ncbi:hypothetical protein [Curtobacterium poinsettiae]|uniref:SbtR family transcriptional regulator n=1 Tax=Curtobacterium poinsettiae TaxID=159612 RepID=UPI0037C07DB4